MSVRRGRPLSRIECRPARHGRREPHFRGKPAVLYRMLPIRRILAARHRNIAGRVTAIQQPHIRASMRQTPKRVARRLLFLLLNIDISGGLVAWVLFEAGDWELDE